MVRRRHGGYKDKDKDRKGVCRTCVRGLERSLQRSRIITRQRAGRRGGAPASASTSFPNTIDSRRLDDSDIVEPVDD